MTAPDLLPCPFCGEADQDTLLVQHLAGTIRRPAFRVCCDNCGASSRYSDQGDHVAVWNTRATPAAMTPEVRALVELLEAWVELASHCSIEEGVCCCGDNIEGHSNPMDCGHSPVDHGSYVARHLVERTIAALRAGGDA